MAHALEMFFDDATDAAVRRSWDRLEQVGVTSLATTTHGRHQPHVTLAVADEIAVDDELVRILSELPGGELDFPVLGSFSGKEAVLFLGATVSGPLLGAHADVHMAIAEHSKGLWVVYMPGLWVPHCTLAMQLGAEDLAKAVAALHPYAGLRATIARIGLTDTETGDVEILVGEIG